jgi:hypothetical protein
MNEVSFQKEKGELGEIVLRNWDGINIIKK